MKRIFLATLIAAATVAGPSPVAAGAAAAFCDYSPTNHRVTISIVGMVSQTFISRDGLGRINLDGTWCENMATVTNTDAIVVTGDASIQTVIIELANGGFKPGFTNEPGASDEIEFVVDLAAGYDIFSIRGSKGAQKIDLGQGDTQLGLVRRVNLNSGESTGVDSDIAVLNAEVFSIDAKGGNDRVVALGKRGTGPDPFGLPLEVWGGGGNDVIKGGSGADMLFGGGGVDLVYGKGGADTIHLADGVNGDIGYGGAGDDLCSTDPGDTCIP